MQRPWATGLRATFAAAAVCLGPGLAMHLRMGVSTVAVSLAAAVACCVARLPSHC